MKDFGKIAGYNLLFIITYAVLLRLISNHIIVMLFSMLFVIGQVLYNSSKSIVYFKNKDAPLGRSYLLSTFLVLIIGFGACSLPGFN